jgi:hypothetical protein
VSPTKEKFVESWSHQLSIQATKAGIKIHINFDDGKFEVREDSNWEDIKKTKRIDKAVELTETAWLRKSNKIKETNQLNSIFETERLRLEKELDIPVTKVQHSYYYNAGRHMKYSSYDCYMIEVPSGSEVNQIKFRSSKEDGISIIQCSKRIPQVAFAAMLNKAAGKIIANEVSHKDAEAGYPLVKARRLNPIK